MRGEIGVESRKGAGSLFWFILPMEMITHATESFHAPRTSMKDLTVMIVDDNSTNRLILREYLHTWGCSVVEAANGEDALEKFSAHKRGGITCALVDYEMPGMDGLEVTSMLRQKAAELKVVLLSSEGNCQAAGTKPSAGPDAYLTKPIKRDRLRQTMESLISSKRPGIVAESPPGGAVKKPAAPPHILVAEDNLINQKVAELILKKCGFTHRIVDNGQQVLDALQESSFDLILMDLRMPEMDGFMAAKAIREKEGREGGRIPIIALTAYAAQDEEKSCHEAGIDGCLNKPVQSEELRDMIVKMLSLQESVKA